MTQQDTDRVRNRPRPGAGRTLAVAVAIAALIASAACGGDDADGGGLSSGGAGDGATRTVEVAMVDNEFSPADLEVVAGETVRFVFTNDGAVTHDAIIGDEAAQAEHEDEMSSAGDDAMEGMGHGSEDAGDGGAITVEPGETGELVHTFAAADDVLIGCHEPGHYDAGMRIDVEVSDP